MGRGGRRSTTFNPTWKHGKTRTIRVPITLAEEILNFAKERDEGVTQTKDNSQDYEREIILTALTRYIEAQQQESGANQHRRKGEPLDIDNVRDWKHFRRFMREIEGNE